MLADSVFVKIQLMVDFFPYERVFLRARACNALRVLAIIWASVCQSVCHTVVLYQTDAS